MFLYQNLFDFNLYNRKNLLLNLKNKFKKLFFYNLRAISKDCWNILLEHSFLIFQYQSKSMMELKPPVFGSSTSAAAAAICAYPKWFVPLSFPVTMGHLSNLAPRCTLPNCACLDSYQFH